MVILKATDLHSEREIVTAKFFAYLANPSLAEHNNVVEAMGVLEDMEYKAAAVRRRAAKDKRMGVRHENSDS